MLRYCVALCMAMVCQGQQLPPLPQLTPDNKQQLEKIGEEVGEMIQSPAFKDIVKSPAARDLVANVESPSVRDNVARALPPVVKDFVEAPGVQEEIEAVKNGTLDYTSPEFQDVVNKAAEGIATPEGQEVLRRTVANVVAAVSTPQIQDDVIALDTPEALDMIINTARNSVDPSSCKDLPVQDCTLPLFSRVCTVSNGKCVPVNSSPDDDGGSGGLSGVAIALIVVGSVLVVGGLVAGLFLYSRRTTPESDYIGMNTEKPSAV